MNNTEIEQQNAVLNALVSAAHSCGMKLKQGAEDALLAAIIAKGVTASTDETGLVLKQGATEMVIASCFKTLRAAHEDLFVYDPRHAGPEDIVCRADFHGSPSEILQKKAKWISEHAAGAYEELPATREEAERRSVVPSATMSRAEYLCLSLRDKAQLSAIVGPSGIARIMARTK